MAQRRTRDQLPIVLEYPAELPITAHRNEIMDLIRDRQVTIVCGETGSGKSTSCRRFASRLDLDVAR